MNADGAQERPSPKRFYETVSIRFEGDDMTIYLDERCLTSSGRKKIKPTNLKLAEKIEQEWREQKDVIDMRSMVMTRYQMTITDMRDEDRVAWQNQILQTLSNDLLCYRAVEPEALTRRQAEVWDPILAKFKDLFLIELEVTAGIIAVEQADRVFSLARLELKKLSDECLLSVRRIAELTGSTVLSMMALNSALTVEALIETAEIDEKFQVDRWGEDEEATQRRNDIAKEIHEAYQFMRLAS